MVDVVSPPDPVAIAKDNTPAVDPDNINKFDEFEAEIANPCNDVLLLIASLKFSATVVVVGVPPALSCSTNICVDEFE